MKDTASNVIVPNVVITIPPQQNQEEITPGVTNVTNDNGTVSGRLCYPSEMIPPGSIEAKRTTDNKIFTQEYKGSQNGGGNTYSFSLEPGIYNMRFAPQGSSLYGYHTTVCLTGLETTCGDTNPRQLVPATVLANQSVVAYDLCDFYYQPQNAPVF